MYHKNNVQPNIFRGMIQVEMRLGRTKIMPLKRCKILSTQNSSKTVGQKLLYKLKEWSYLQQQMRSLENKNWCKPYFQCFISLRNILRCLFFTPLKASIAGHDREEEHSPHIQLKCPANSVIRYFRHLPF